MSSDITPCLVTYNLSTASYWIGSHKFGTSSPSQALAHLDSICSRDLTDAYVEVPAYLNVSVGIASPRVANMATLTLSVGVVRGWVRAFSNYVHVEAANRNRSLADRLLLTILAAGTKYASGRR